MSPTPVRLATLLTSLPECFISTLNSMCPKVNSLFMSSLTPLLAYCHCLSMVQCRNLGVIPSLSLTCLSQLITHLPYLFPWPLPLIKASLFLLWSSAVLKDPLPTVWPFSGPPLLPKPTCHRVTLQQSIARKVRLG